MTAEFLALTVSLALLAALLIAIPLWRCRGGTVSGVVGATLALVGLPLAVLSLYTQATTYPWDNPERLQSPATATPGEVLEMVEQLAARMEKAPTPEGLAMLGRSYQTLERYEDSVQAWHKAWELTEGKAPMITLNYAEALIIADRDSLLMSAGDLLEDVLPAMPDNPKALWYGGLSAVARGNIAVGRQRWARLLTIPDIPPALRELVQRQLAALPAAKGEEAAPAEPPGPVYDVTVQLDPALADQAATGATLYVFAREAGAGGGPPLAVRRVTDARLPLTLQISDANAMVRGGQKLDQARRLQITARLSRTGNAIASPGDLYGTADIDPSTDETAVTVIIDSVQGN